MSRDPRDTYRPSYDPDSRSRYDPRDRHLYDRGHAHPPPPDYYQHPPPPPSREHRDDGVYRFTAGGGDAYRSQPSTYPRPGDNYRPVEDRRPIDDAAQRWNNQREQNDFNFRSAAAMPQPSFPPAVPQRRQGRPPAKEPRYGPRRGASHAPYRGNGARRGGKAPSDRAILRAGRSPTPEQLEGMNGGNSRFKVMDDLSGSESEEMDLGTPDDVNHVVQHGARVKHTAEDSDDDEHPRAKRARMASPQLSDVKPKWSNPDPYTALPPPGQAKRKDVVKLIRKAKVDDGKNANNAAGPADFISLNFDEPDDGSESETVSVNGRHTTVQDDMSAQPPKFSHLDNLHPERTAPPAAAVLGKADVWPPAPSSATSQQQLGTAVRKQEAGAVANKGAKAGSKRKRDDRRAELGDVTDVWQALDQEDDLTPWRSDDHAESKDADLWLHQEILDFYEYVRPQAFEEQVREDLIQRMQSAVSRTYPHARIHAFGSYAAGLYLPTADMDLVAVSSSFEQYGVASLCRSYNQMRKFATELERADIISSGTLTIIANARVPLVKFVEKATGLRVDISFENNSGLVANSTFARWKEDYPAMPIIVTLIKQFLAMRGLSEVFNGGLGGYSVICLVVSIVHNLEESHGQQWSARGHLDEVLLTFLKHFGRTFNITNQGIDIKNMKYVNKGQFRGKRSRPDRLLIIDPNNPTNDISGGSANVGLIFDRFDDAFDTLCSTMETVVEEAIVPGRMRSSILGSVWGGNYDSFEIQRARLSKLFGQSSRLLGASAQDPIIVQSDGPAEQAHVPGIGGKFSATNKAKATKGKKAPKAAKAAGPAHVTGTKQAPAAVAKSQKKQKKEKGEKVKHTNVMSAKARARKFKDMHPGVEAPASLSKKNFKLLKKQHSG